MNLDKIITMRCTEKQKAVFNAKLVREYLDYLDNLRKIDEIYYQDENGKLHKKVSE